MKKVLIFLGIGCGGLLVVGFALLAIGGLWAKKTLGNVAALGEEVKAQQAQAKELYQQYPFTAPTADKPVVLSEDWLNAYLAVRDRAMPIHKDFEATVQSFKTRHPEQGQKTDISGALEAANMVAGLMSSLRKTYLEGLRDQHMSPREFGAITTAIYTTAATQGMAQQRPVLQKQLDSLTTQAQSATGEQKALLEQQIVVAKQTIQALPSPKDEAALTANADLLTRYKDRIQKGQDAAFDMWVVTGFGEGGMGAIGVPGEKE